MFPKAHAAAYVMSAIRLGWYKVHIPIAFYCSMFTTAPGGFDAEIVGKGRSHVIATIKDIEKRGKNNATPNELASIPSLQLANECMDGELFKIQPGYNGISWLEGGTDEEGNAIESAPHPKQRVLLNMPEGVSVGDFVRRSIK